MDDATRLAVWLDVLRRTEPEVDLEAVVAVLAGRFPADVVARAVVRGLGAVCVADVGDPVAPLSDERRAAAVAALARIGVGPDAGW